MILNSDPPLTWYCSSSIITSPSSSESLESISSFTEFCCSRSDALMFSVTSKLIMTIKSIIDHHSIYRTCWSISCPFDTNTKIGSTPGAYIGWTWRRKTIIHLIKQNKKIKMFVIIWRWFQYKKNTYLFKINIVILLQFIDHNWIFDTFAHL